MSKRRDWHEWTKTHWPEVPPGIGRTAKCYQLERACVDREFYVRPRHDLDKDGRCVFCDWLLPEGFVLCGCGRRGCSFILENVRERDRVRVRKIYERRRERYNAERRERYWMDPQAGRERGRQRNRERTRIKMGDD